MKTNVIRCPDCEAKGVKQNLAMQTDNGLLSIRRFKHFGQAGDSEYTLVGGTSFAIICGRCGGTAYYKQGDNNEGTLANNGGFGIHWQSFSFSLGTVRAGGN